ncbi:sensor domain-containing diguanylate cyclase [Synechococcus sp. BS56D]|jgi:diguanylate cyclase (GGDEF)-like protein|uniref:sensor domain-containing diguanylate cyclase n=1 Tax=unclassified Synechococcus TaxID=2626047 RepID=UPI00103C43A8|nr:sensor domain-containing diguanylate cyclase [Synechococcaceae bacterium WB9_4xB_025]TCD57019.1 sensor domain-containing diguanylate cyclase [Synechococcus sp. BS55D]TCD58687.1 sensor domain-containing diguanylate cyclase [Synechococcus sp. BS56D]
MACASVVRTGRETRRLRELRRLDRAGLEHDPALALLVKLASSCMATPIAMVSMVEADQQKPLLGHGCDLEAIPRELSFCSMAIEADADLFVVPDAAIDPRFRDNPLVSHPLGVRFYAAAVLQGPSGGRLGTLCVLDHRAPHQPSDRQLQQLRWLADLVTLALERHEQHLLCPVTGLPTLGQLLRVGRKEWQSALNAERPLALLLLDLNNFRAINRCCGHEQGDRFLQEVAGAIASHCRPEDFVAHVQADRFALLLPLANADEGLELARTFQQMLATLDLGVAPPGYRMLPVAGLALNHVDDEGFDALVHRSEQALELARLQGNGAIVELRDGIPSMAAAHSAGHW